MSGPIPHPHHFPMYPFSRFTSPANGWGIKSSFFFFFWKTTLPLKMSSRSFPFSPNSLLVQHLGIGRKEGDLWEDFGEAVGQWVSDKLHWTWSRSCSSQTLPFRPGNLLNFRILISLIYRMRKWILNFRILQSSLIQPLRVTLFTIVNPEPLTGLQEKCV